jgi:hypothetical protein
MNAIRSLCVEFHVRHVSERVMHRSIHLNPALPARRTAGRLMPAPRAPRHLLDGLSYTFREELTCSIGASRSSRKNAERARRL